MSRVRSTDPPPPSRFTAYLPFLLSCLSLFVIMTATLVVLLGVRNLLFGLNQYRQAPLSAALEVANRYCAHPLEHSSEPPGEDYLRWTRGPRLSSGFLEAWYETEKAKYLFLNIGSRREIERLFMTPSQENRPLSEFIPPRTPRPGLWEGEAADFDDSTLKMDAYLAAAVAIDAIYSIDMRSLLELSDPLKPYDTIQELARVSASGNCKWSLSKIEEPDLWSLLGHLVATAADVWDLGPYWHYKWRESYQYFDSWRGIYILSFTNLAVEDTYNPDGLSVLVSVAPGATFVRNVIGLFLLGWTACVTIWGMAFVWLVLRPLRVLGRGSLEAGKIVRTNDKVPAKLTDLAGTLPGRTPAVLEYRKLLLDLSAVLREREVWLGSMLHHLKNDLNVIIFGLDDIKSVPDGAAQVRPDIEKATGRIRNMLNNVTTYQWTQFGKPEDAGPIDLGSLLETIVDDIIDAGGDAVCSGHEEIHIVARKQALQSALQNLLWNAHHYGGAVAVRVEIAEERDAAEIVVDDNGPGIPEDDMEEVFRPYSKGKRQLERASGGFVGAGLGLSIARRVISDHGGEISLENRRAADGGIEGLRVRVVLPLNGPVTAETGG